MNRNKLFLGILSLFFLLNVNAQGWTLDDCFQYLSEHDIQFKMAGLETEMSQQDVHRAYADLFPDINLYGDNNYNYGFTVDPTTNGRVSADILSNSFSVSGSFNLLNLSGIQRIKQAKIQQEISAVEEQLTLYQLRVKTVGLFYNLQYEKERLQLLEHQKNLTVQHLNRLEQEVSIGNKSKSDLYDLQAQFEQEKQQLIGQENKVKNAKLLLSQLLQLPDTLVYDLSQSSLPIELTLLSKENFNTPEVELAQLSYKQSQHILMEKQWNRLPKIYISYSYSSFYVKDLINSQNTVGFQEQLKANQNKFVGASVSIPIFNGLNNKTTIQKAKLDVVKNDYKTILAQKNMQDQWQQTFNSAQQNYNLWLQSQEVLKAVKISYEKASEKFAAGMIDSYGFFSAKNYYLQSESELLQVKYQYWYYVKLLELMKKHL